ncbi:MAG: CvpA family protein, partial [Oscillospiraceae bacterium]|nr:CvpA family protein [Candidatus Equicaccousia limihippi]
VQIDKQNVEQSVDDTWRKLPDYITDVAGHFGVTQKGVTDTIIEKADQTSDKMVTDIVDSIAKPIIVSILKTILYIVLFLIISAILRFVTRPLIKIFKLPIIGGLNRFLGGVLGLLKGLVVATLVCISLNMLTNLTQNGFLIFTQQNIDNTIIFKFLANII